MEELGKFLVCIYVLATFLSVLGIINDETASKRTGWAFAFVLCALTTYYILKTVRIAKGEAP